MTEENRASQTGKIAIVTGGSRGIGRNTVLHLASRGVQSILTYQSNRDEAEKVVAAVREAGSRAIALELNVGDPRTLMPLSSRSGVRSRRWGRSALTTW